ncbi:hypothetical protein AYO39_02165 [Actinobacteria bacterium SCGC AG-212-D09]|nr:hypothetical protein AYO39_02165 [Actinobacteria bacterium SCGC AG-212-D09]
MRVGEDLTPHLSERVETAYISESDRPGLPGQRRDADRDRMLNAWGIHHLHLSSEPGRDGFNARGGDLLYAIFRPDHAYLLGIHTHNDWAREGLVRVIVRNWPDAGLFLRSNIVQGMTTQFTDDDRRQLRRAAVNEALYEVDGAFYGPQVWARQRMVARSRPPAALWATRRAFASSGRTSMTTSPGTPTSWTIPLGTQSQESGHPTFTRTESACSAGRTPS